MNPNRLLKVGIYLRLSNEDKDKQNNISESIKNQRNMLIEYINKNPSFILVKEYCDEDISGAGSYRPAFEQLIKDCEKGILNIVLCKSQSRFSRDMEVVEKYINNKFLEWNVRFISICDNADTMISGNKKSRQINGLVNEWFLEDVSNNIRSAFNSKMKNGEFISPFAPFGYKISPDNNNKLIIDHYAASIVSLIFDLFLSGMNTSSIAKYLNNKNISSPSFYKYQKGIKLNIVSKKKPSDIKWNSTYIKNLLKNEIYIGNLIQGKRTTVSYKNHKIINKPNNKWIKVNSTHEAIIDKKKFSKVQEIINKRKKSSPKSYFIHIFSGKVFCQSCNNLMRKKSSSKHDYLVCYHDCINKDSIRYDTLEKIILKELNKLINEYFNENYLKEKIISYNKNMLKNKIATLQKEKKNLSNELQNNNNYIKNLYKDKVKGIIDEKIFKELTSSFNKDKIKLTELNNNINNKLNYYKDKYSNFNNDLQKYKAFLKLNRFIIEEMIDKIYIGKINKTNKTRNIKIKWNF